jgi:hypothetical protein
MLENLRTQVGTLWCNVMHDSAMWPVHGEYQCRTCGRHYPAFREAPVVSWAKPVALKPGVLVLLAVAIAAASRPAHAVEPVQDHGRAAAEAALYRYLRTSGTPAWDVESVDVHASLPRLEKSGRFQAIRSVAPAGFNYEVLEVSGDRTVKQQVIVRYLNAEERASQMPASSVAVTADNYKFAYKGLVYDEERPAYAFRMTPRKKRDGLMKGELWLDAATGLPVRRAGYLVKSPSVWVKRVAVTQEYSLHDSRVESRLTHIVVDTRLVGRAELIVAESPLRHRDDQKAIVADSAGGQQ